MPARLPVGVDFVARPFDEAMLFRIASAYVEVSARTDKAQMRRSAERVGRQGGGAYSSGFGAAAGAGMRRNADRAHQPMDNATGKFTVRTIDGNKVLVKLTENPFAFAKRCRPFFGGTEYSNYTIEADVRSMERRRQMADVGIVAQRYELVLFGNHQRLELQPWQPETQRTAKIEFKWKPDAWYVMKLEVQSLGAKGVRARGKVWPKGEAEPAAWTIERIDPIGSLKGSPGLYADAPSAAGGGSEIYYDNIKVYRNK